MILEVIFQNLEQMELNADDYSKNKNVLQLLMLIPTFKV